MASELKPCPWCGQLPEVEWLAGHECVRHENSECPICPVLGWSLCVWQTRAAPVDGWTRVQERLPTADDADDNGDVMAIVKVNWGTVATSPKLVHGWQPTPEETT